MDRVRTNATYVYDPGFIDTYDPPHGVQAKLLKPGDTVRVVKLYGCPPPNTMGHCHINTMDGQFAGLVRVGSLQRKAT